MQPHRRRDQAESEARALVAEMLSQKPAQTNTGLLKTAGYVVLIFAALGMYLFAGAAATGTGGKPLPLGRPLMK